MIFKCQQFGDLSGPQASERRTIALLEKTQPTSDTDGFFFVFPGLLGTDMESKQCHAL